MAVSVSAADAMGAMKIPDLIAPAFWRGMNPLRLRKDGHDQSSLLPVRRRRASLLLAALLV